MDFIDITPEYDYKSVCFLKFYWLCVCALVKGQLPGVGFFFPLGNFGVELGALGLRDCRVYPLSHGIF